jgi:hypothetical protein
MISIFSSKCISIENIKPLVYKRQQTTYNLRKDWLPVSFGDIRVLGFRLHQFFKKTVVYNLGFGSFGRMLLLMPKAQNTQFLQLKHQSKKSEPNYLNTYLSTKKFKTHIIICMYHKITVNLNESRWASVILQKLHFIASTKSHCHRRDFIKPTDPPWFQTYTCHTTFTNNHTNKLVKNLNTPQNNQSLK